MPDINKKLENLHVSHNQIGREVQEVTQEDKKLERVIQGAVKHQTKATKEDNRSPTRLTRSKCRKLIGERVYILSPRLNEPNTGRIESVGDIYTSVIES